jgi:hypothetical protein
MQEHAAKGMEWAQAGMKEDAKKWEAKIRGIRHGEQGKKNTLVYTKLFMLLMSIPSGRTLPRHN